MGVIDYSAIAAASVCRQHFPYFVCKAIGRADAENIAAAFPQPSIPIRSAPTEELSHISPICRLLADEIHGDKFRAAIADKFDENLDDKAVYLRWNSHHDFNKNRPHRDRPNRFITMLWYFNMPDWECCDQAPLWLHQRPVKPPPTYDPALSAFRTIYPTAGTFVAFRTTGDDWHSVKPFEGKRQVLVANFQKSGEKAQF